MSANRPGSCPANVYLRAAGERTDLDGVLQTVQRPCDKKKGGIWYCEAHAKKFKFDAGIWAHTNEVSPHVLVWICPLHGPEQPGE